MSKNSLRFYFAILILAGVVLLVYVGWLPFSYSGDDLQYAMVIEQATSDRTLYHPTGTVNLRLDSDAQPQNERKIIPVNIRYILEYPSSILFVKIWQRLGWDGDVILPILWLRMLAGVLGLIFFFLALHRMTHKVGISLVVSFGLATTLTYWTYSTHIDQSISMILFSCVGLFVLAHVYHHSKGIMIAAIALGAATLFNFTAAVLAAAVTLTLFFLLDRGKIAVASKSFAFTASYFLLVAVVLIGALLWVNQTRKIDADFFKSASFYGHPEYLMEFPRDVIRAVFGSAKSQVTFPGYSGSLQALWDQSSNRDRAVILSFYGAILLFMAVPVFIFIANKPAFTREERNFGLTLIAWFVFFSMFNIWWDPGYIKYWLIPLTCWWALTGLVLSRLKAQSSKGYAWLMVGLVTLVAFTFVTNFLSTFLPESKRENNISLSTALSIKEVSSPFDLFISPGTPLDFYLAYFSERDVRSVGLLAYGTGGDMRRIHNVVSLARDQHLSAGGEIYILKPRNVSPSDYQLLLDLMGNVPLELVWSYSDVEVYRLLQ